MNRINGVRRNRADRVRYYQIRQLGFTLYELLITLGIAGSLSTAGTGLYSIVHEHRISAEINQFLAHLSLARSESLKRRQEIALCPSSNGRDCDRGTNYSGWHRGALLFVDVNGNGRLEPEDVVIRILAPSDGLQIKSTRGPNPVVFRPDGFASGTNRTFTFCRKGGGPTTRYVIMSNTGRARVASTPSDGRADEPLERCA